MADDDGPKNIADIINLSEVIKVRAGGYADSATSTEEYAELTWKEQIQRAEAIETGEDLGLDRNSRFHLVVCRLAQFVSPPWQAWTSERIREVLGSMAKARKIPGWEGTLESAIAWGKEKPAKVPDSLKKAARKAKAAELPKLQNFNWEKNEDGDYKKVEKSVKDIVDDIHTFCCDWPRKVGEALFYHQGDKIAFLPSTAKLTSWLSDRVKIEIVSQTKGLKAPTMTEIFAGLEMYAKHDYVTVEEHPHTPPIKGSYYVDELPVADGKVLHDFLKLLNPDSVADLELLWAMLATLMWGGGAGLRPAFILTSEHGKGVGKTATAEAFCEIFGGSIDLDLESERWDRVKERILTTEAFKKRSILVDNLKGKLDMAPIEKAITSMRIGGRKMYVGDYERPNYLTWIFTSNSFALSSDLADRSVIINIGPKRHDVDFREQIQPYLPGGALHRPLLSSLRGFIEGPVLCRPRLDRFGPWGKAILSRLPHGEMLADVIRARRADHDSDAEEVIEIYDVLLRWQRTHPESATREGRAALPGSELLTVFRQIWPDCNRTQEVRQRLRPFCGHGPLKSVECPKTKIRLVTGARVRGVVWEPFSEDEKSEKK